MSDLRPKNYPAEEEFVSLRRAADYCQCSVGDLYLLAEENYLRLKRQGEEWVVLKEDLEAYLESKHKIGRRGEVIADGKLAEKAEIPDVLSQVVTIQAKTQGAVFKPKPRFARAFFVLPALSFLIALGIFLTLPATASAQSGFWTRLVSGLKITAQKIVAVPQVVKEHYQQSPLPEILGQVKIKPILKKQVAQRVKGEQNVPPAPQVKAPEPARHLPLEQSDTPIVLYEEQDNQGIDDLITRGVLGEATAAEDTVAVLDLAYITAQGASTEQELQLLGPVYFGQGITVAQEAAFTGQVTAAQMVVSGESKIGNILRVGTKEFYVNALLGNDNRVGVNTAHPQHALDVNGAVKVIHNLYLIDDAKLYQDLRVIGKTDLTGVLEAAGGVFVRDKFLVKPATGDLETEGTLRVFDEAHLYSNAYVQGHLLLKGSNQYINFNTTLGSLGYGFRDNAGTMQYKNSSGSWTGFSSDTSSSFWTQNGTAIYYNTGNVGIGTTTPEGPLSVRGYPLFYRNDGVASGEHLLGWFRKGNNFASNEQGLYFGYRADGASVTGTFMRQAGNGGELSLGTYSANQAILITNAGNVGIGTTQPDRKLDILDATDPQLRLSKADGAAYADFRTNAAGDLTITPSGSNLLLSDTSTLIIGGVTSRAYNVIGDHTNTMGHGLASDDDLYIEGDLEVDGSAWFDGSETVAGDLSGGNILVSGANSYLNFNATIGTGGYGFRDSGGTIQYKNSGGSWASLAALTGESLWTDAGSYIHPDTATSVVITDTNYVGIGTTNPGVALDVHNGWIQASNQYGLSLKDTGGTGRIALKVDASDNLQLGDNNTFGNILFLPGAAEQMRLTSAGRLGIGTTQPDRKLDILDASNPQLRLTKADGAAYADFQTNSAGDLTITPSGSNLLLSDTSTLIIGGVTARAYNVIGDHTNTMGHGLASDDDLYIEGDLEVDGSAWFDGSVTVANKFTVDSNTFHVNADTNRVGIGTTGPAYKLDVNGDLRLGATDSTDANIYSYAGGLNLRTKDEVIVYLDDDGDNVGALLVKDQWNRNAGVISEPGNMGLGFNNISYMASNIPAYTFQVVNDTATYLAHFFNDGNNADRYGFLIQAGADDGSGTTPYITAKDGNGDIVGYIQNGSGTFQLVDVSDLRTKTNITDTQIQGLNVINGLRVVDFNRLQNPDGPTLHGFIAQEAQEVFPDMVNEGSDGMLGISYVQLVPVLTKAIQEQDHHLSVLDQGMLLLSSHVQGLLSDSAPDLLALEATLQADQTLWDQRLAFFETALATSQDQYQDLSERLSSFEAALSAWDTSANQPEQTTQEATQAGAESLEDTLYTLIDSLDSLDNVSGQLSTISNSILTVLQSNQANTARIQELEQEADQIKQILHFVDEKVVIGSSTQYLVLDAATGLEIKSENFVLDPRGNLTLKGTLNLLSGKINAENGLLELNPGEDAEGRGRVVVRGDLEVTGNLVLGASTQSSADPLKGRGTIGAGQTYIQIDNQNVTADSLIYITPTSYTFDQVLYISEIREKDYYDSDDEAQYRQGFTVSINKAVEENIEFNWWITPGQGVPGEQGETTESFKEQSASTEESVAPPAEPSSDSTSSIEATSPPLPVPMITGEPLNPAVSSPGETLDTTSQNTIVMPPLSEAASVITSLPRLRILSAEAGYLNVRAAPATTTLSDIVSQVYFGEEYEYAQILDGWYEIILKDGSKGWVSGEYIQVMP